MKTKKSKINLESGAAMLTAVIFFLFISLAIVFGIVSPVVREYKISHDYNYSIKSFFLSESAIEDAYYRIKNSITLGTTDTITLGGDTGSATITDTQPGEKTVSSLGDVVSHQRKNDLVSKTGIGVTFDYSAIAGTGGIIIGDHANVSQTSLTGTSKLLFSNGNITGNTATPASHQIFGSATAANGQPTILDQANDTPVPPTYDDVFGDSNFYSGAGGHPSDLAQSFQIASTSNLNKISLYLKKFGTPNDITLRLTSDSGGQPDPAGLMTTLTIPASSISNSLYNWIDVVLPSKPVLNASTTYWIVLSVDQQVPNNYYIIGANSSYSNGVSELGVYNNFWYNRSRDLYFRAYTSPTSTISNVLVGYSTPGDGWGHNIINSSINGSAYCQVGSGNTDINGNAMSCNTSRNDPDTVAFPVEDAYTQEWKNSAAAGGVFTGNKTINTFTFPTVGSCGTTNCPVNLGPMKITGNLTISNRSIVTLTGPVWVQGNITIGTNAKISISPSYGSTGEVLISDSYISAANSYTFFGSGAAGSYMLVISTSDCPTSPSCSGHNAISMGPPYVAPGGFVAASSILNAQNGTVSMSGYPFRTSQVTAKTISILDNAQVSFDGYLGKVFFPSGTGKHTIGSWGETK